MGHITREIDMSREKLLKWIEEEISRNDNYINSYRSKIEENEENINGWTGYIDKLKADIKELNQALEKLNEKEG